MRDDWGDFPDPNRALVGAFTLLLAAGYYSLCLTILSHAR